MNQSSIANTVDKYLSLPPAGFGSYVSVLKFTGLAQTRGHNGRVLPNGVNEHPVYAPGVPVVGLVTLDPSPETVSQYGGVVKKYDISVLWSVLELKRRFPTLVEPLWVVDNDIIEYAGNTYLLNKVVPTAQSGLGYTLVMAFGSTRRSDTLAGP